MRTRFINRSAKKCCEVGQFARRGDDFGMIDAVHGDRLGFVWSGKDSWTAELVDEDEVTICESDEDCSRALNSAREYFSRERDSIRGRMAMQYKQDNKEVLQEMMKHCETWLKSL